MSGNSLVLPLFTLLALPLQGLAAPMPAPDESRAIRIVRLTCEGLIDPLGIDANAPRLTWQMMSDGRGEKQIAYQVIVSTLGESLREDRGDLWNSGRVESDVSVNIPYGGRQLTSGQFCYWKVRVWNVEGEPSAWSAPAKWSMGLLASSDWGGKWIGLDPVQGRGDSSGTGDRRLPSRWLRKEFDAPKSIVRGTAYICGLGLSELYVNGEKAGDDVLSPALSQYTKRDYYVTHDVTALLRRGKNALGVVLGNGRFYAPRVTQPTLTQSFGYPKLMFRLRVEYADGSAADVVSDGSWKLTTAGPIRANNEYDGEEYDARMELNGWASPGYNDAGWEPAHEVESPGGVLRAQMIDPIRVTGTLVPASIKELKQGVVIVDMGQNMVGWCRIHVAGTRGTRITLRHAETLKPDGTLYLDNLRGARVTDTYTLRGNGPETYEPRFTYHGFRYVELTGFPGRPEAGVIEGRVVNDDVTSAGEFMCSQPVINRTYRNIVWGVRGNYRSMPTDCPQRDERQGWLGDRSAESRGETYLFGVNALYAKWLQDMEDEQKENGSVSDVCPSYWPLYNDDVTWPSSTVIIPDALRDQYGDEEIIRRHYAGMVKWIDHMSAFDTNGVMTRDSYGDWCVPPEDPKLIHSNDPKRKTAPGILATSYFYYDLRLMARYAAIAGNAADARRFDGQAQLMRDGLNRTYLNDSLGTYGNGSQTSCVLPLAFDMVPAGARERVFRHLTWKITHETGGHTGTGLVGGQWLNRVLSDNGRPDLVYRFVTDTTYPGWGYMAAKGATTIWELWNGDRADPAMNSGNHVMLVGDLVLWLFEDVAGMKPDPAHPGFKHILMHPTPVGDLAWVRATHESPYGRIVSNWTLEKGVFAWTVAVPVNATATIYVPAQSPEDVTEGGKPARGAEGVTFIKEENGFAAFDIGPGSYTFRSQTR